MQKWIKNSALSKSFSTASHQVHQLSTLWPFLTSNPFPKMFLDFVFFTPKFNYTYVFTSILGPTEPRSNHFNFQHRTFHPFWTLFPLCKRLPGLTRAKISQIVYTRILYGIFQEQMMLVTGCLARLFNFGTSTQVHNSSILDIFIILEKKVFASKIIILTKRK